MIMFGWYAENYKGAAKLYEEFPNFIQQLPCSVNKMFHSSELDEIREFFI